MKRKRTGCHLSKYSNLSLEIHRFNLKGITLIKNKNIQLDNDTPFCIVNVQSIKNKFHLNLYQRRRYARLLSWLLHG